VLVRIRFKHGVKSYEIIYRLLKELYSVYGRRLSIVDLTYGYGRFYRLSRHLISKLVGVDVVRYDWEVVPDVFYQMDCRVFVSKVLRGELSIEPDLIVVDPPWSHEKRGVMARKIGISNMPYHIKDIDSTTIINTAVKLAKHYSVPLLYRYKEALNYNHIILAEAEVKIIRNTGKVFYGICLVS
jgi:hypothetical protein